MTTHRHGVVKRLLIFACNTRPAGKIVCYRNLEIRRPFSCLTCFRRQLYVLPTYTLGRTYVKRCLSVSLAARQQNGGSSTIDDSEVNKFTRLAETWWDEAGEFSALHTMNRLRVPFIRDGLVGQNRETTVRTPQPLRGLTIADVGCGGGILSEALTRLGANVTGVDAGQENIRVAELHMSSDPALFGRLRYACTTVEDLAHTQPEAFDGVVASEVLEHVADPGTFVKGCGQLVKPGGSLFFTTLNKTFCSYAFGIFAAEQILRIVPSGAHDWNKFVSPSDLEVMLSHNGFVTCLIHGMTLNPLTSRWKWTANTSINYAVHAIKDELASSSESSDASSSSTDNEDHT